MTVNGQAYEWLGDADGRAMRILADAGAATGNLPWVAVPSPAGDHVALWASNSDGHLTVVDLRDGRVTRISGPFRRAAFDGRASLVWSPDGELIAGSDSDEDGVAGAKTRARIVDAAMDRTVRTIEGGVFAVSSFPSGELVVIRDSGERGAGARWAGVVLGFDGVEHRRYLGGSWTMSPDTRFLLQSEAGGAGMPGYTLIDLAAGTSFGFGVPALFSRWLAGGRIAFVSY